MDPASSYSLLGDSLAAGLAPAIPDVTGLYKIGVDSRTFVIWLAHDVPALGQNIIVSLGANDLGVDPEPYWGLLLDIVGDRHVTWLLPSNANRYTVRGLMHMAALRGVSVFDTTPYVGGDKLHIDPARASALVANLIHTPAPDWLGWYARAFRLHNW
jgi:hypothetical protein